MTAMSSVSEASLSSSLPSHIRERIRLAKAGHVSTGRVVYWMRLALRGHENPALDAAICVANTLKVPMIVLLHLEDQYPHATARRQMFLLQGARCAEEELARRGIRTVVQVDRKGNRPETLMALAKSASLVIAEEPFCVPWLAGVEKLQHGDFGCPLWLVDCSSVVPSALVSKQSCHRAYQFENSTRQMHAARISFPWQDVHLDATMPDEAVVAQSLNLRDADLAPLVTEMDVDHSVKPVEHTIGGCKHGYQRWSDWIAAGGLKTYAKRRNESLDVHGVSRMSAYLNAGMVSPLRLAREASAAKGAGLSKFLNEFLTWRGLTYAWCYHFPMPSSGCTLSQLPSWASETLKKHATDRRIVISRERLANACSRDHAWDSMQRYLVDTGELHNNARMGWGCAIPKWTASPEEAMQMLVDLNNTFALDGHAPPSYGGLLGCLGLFSGPKGEAAVFGKVSARACKAKYAALPAQISVLVAGIGASATPSLAPSKNARQEAATPLVSVQSVNQHESYYSPIKQAPTSANSVGLQALLESFGRGEKRNIKEGMETWEQGHVVPKGDTPSPERRWRKLKADPQEAPVIELD